MDANSTPNPALMRAYPYFAGAPIPQMQHQVPLPAPPQSVPPHAAPVAAPQLPRETNSCERLIHVARSMRARPVYKIQRIGGEDHLPLFRAYVVLPPLGYSAEGTGRSKMTSRRDAAANMLKIISGKAAGVTAAPPDVPPPPPAAPAPQPIPHRSSPLPKMEAKEEPARPNVQDGEIEEGELASDENQAKNAEKPPLFFVDREPDPTLEKEVEDVGKSEESLPQAQQDAHLVVSEKDDGTNRGPTASADEPSTKSADVLPAVPRLSSISVPEPLPVKEVQDAVQSDIDASAGVAKRKRTQPAEEETPAEAEQPPKNVSYIPPRKRTKSIPRDFPMRMRLWIYCDYTERSVESLRALAEANLFVDMSVFVYSTVSLPKYLLLGKTVAAEVTVLPEEARESPAAVVGAIAFGVGAKSEQIWIERAKHLANGFPLSLSPRVLVVHDDASLSAIKQDGVIDVLKSSDNLVTYLSDLLEKAKETL